MLLLLCIGASGIDYLYTKRMFDWTYNRVERFFNFLRVDVWIGGKKRGHTQELPMQNFKTLVQYLQVTPSD